MSRRLPPRRGEPEIPEIPEHLPHVLGEEEPSPQPEREPARLGYAANQRLHRVLHELASRQAEALTLYEPLPRVEEFHADGKDERLLRGSNRAGKTLGAAVECARAVTGQDPYQKWPATGSAAVVGWDGRHCGQVFYKYLFRSYAFKMIRDLTTGMWRAYRPWTDVDRVHEARYAPPLIPARFVKKIAWEEKARHIPSLVELTTGWELHFYSSKGDPPQGVQFDLWWIDEEIQNEAWYSELVARTVDRHGKGYWSATPLAGNPQLYDLHVRAEDGDENVGEHFVTLADNPHIDEKEKHKLWAKYTSEADRRVRIMGDFALQGFRVYPEFSSGVHGYDLEGPLPTDWTSYLVVDPGRQVCAVLFAAIPPPHVGDFCLLYDELYIRQCDAEKFAKGVAAKSEGRVHERFIIDGHAGRVTEMGSGKSIESQYSQALKAARVKSRTGGYSFLWGADDPKAGIEAVRRWLAIRPSGEPYLRVARGRLPHFEAEIKRYHYKRNRAQGVTDEPEKRHDHLMDDLRYLAVYSPTWQPPGRARPVRSEAVRAMQAKRSKRREESGGAYVRLGPRGR